MKEIAEALILAPYPSTNEYKPIKKPVSKEYFKTFEFFSLLSTLKPNIIIPKQSKSIETVVSILKTTPKKINDMKVATKGPNPLHIGYTFVKSPIW